MRRQNPWWPYAAFLAVALAGWFFARPEAVVDRDTGLAVAPDRNPEAPPDLDRRLEAARRRSALLHRIAQAVVEGRLTLLEAAERFRELNETTPEFSPEVFRRTFSGASDDERYARQVIAVAASQYGRDPHQARVVALRLEAELAKSLRRGTFRLEL